MGNGPIALASGPRPARDDRDREHSRVLPDFAVALAFVLAWFTGWKDAGSLVQYASAVAGLNFGGILAAPLAGYVTSIVAGAESSLGAGRFWQFYQISRLL